jgi:hypothetical protein
MPGVYVPNVAQRGQAVSMGQSSAVQFSQLQDLRFHWGEAYSIHLDNGEFVAARRDDLRELRARTAEGLRELIISDYSANKVPREVTE